MSHRHEHFRTTLYRLFGDGGELLYVGIAIDLKKRLRQHICQWWWPEVAALRVERHPNRLEALSAEKAAIEAEGPKYNTQHAGRRSPAPASCVHIDELVSRSHERDQLRAERKAKTGLDPYDFVTKLIANFAEEGVDAAAHK
ncbi:GIY-YIG nuclease family protein [Nonomuraea terrae]|uniref:GIY-YIG nuclease family protein n=1 Tax=Nonomuraea terrae TaxID=2530383 RepID=UPI0037B3C68A